MFKIVFRLSVYFQLILQKMKGICLTLLFSWTVLLVAAQGKLCFKIKNIQTKSLTRKVWIKFLAQIVQDSSVI